jgi:hypothetical protein
MKRILMIAALTCFASLSALAGDIPTDGFSNEGPATPTSDVSVNSPGDIPTDGVVEQHLSNSKMDLVGLMIGLMF